MMMWLVTVKPYGDHPEQVQDEDEHEEREHEREEPHALLAGGTSHGRGDELVGHLDERLHAARARAARRRVAQSVSSAMTPTAPNMKSDAFVKTISVLPIWPR